MQNTLIGFVAANILGKILWHTVTSDASIESESREHLARVLNNAFDPYCSRISELIQFLCLSNAS